MPRRLITAPGHSRERSLGHLGTWWLETFTLHGAGAMTGQRVQLNDEQYGFVLDVYALDGDGRRLYDSAFFSRPKGCDKSGLAAKLSLLEAFGPCRFDGWAEGGETYEYLGRVYTYSRGEPMGRTITAPMVRILATEEEQTGNTFGTIYFNLTDSRAPLFDLLAWGVQPGLSKIVIPGGGQIVRSTSGAASKDGGLETFVVFDETHLYVTPQLRAMYQTVTDNLGKRAGDAEPWYLETTTMFGPGEESVAESTYELADAIAEGKARRSRLLFDHRYGEISHEDWRDEDKLADAFREAYGDSLAWNPVEMLLNRAYDPRRPVARTRRMRLNSVTEGENAWIEIEAWKSRGHGRLAVDRMQPEPLKRGDVVTLGFDGSGTNDATALIACRVSDRYLFPLLIEEKPDMPGHDDWEVDRPSVDAAVARAFAKYTVVGFYADPPLWQDYVDAWAKEYGSQLRVHASGKHSVGWWTKRDVQMALALERLHTAVALGTMAHEDLTDLGRALTRHVLNARRWSRRGGTVIGKEKKNSPKKIDAAVAAALAFEAAADYAAKSQPAKQASVPFAIR
ncbi:hypothetical protein [Rathayibacter sp. Leaf248]|uniref:hypothetical protein n=1 Tax=Rathayibacter sp. Leaf248 TaxID=2876555 RepID=UPI001E2A42C1|nr:hypothetical protein [Rathayibacter sp. Leaf248]